MIATHNPGKLVEMRDLLAAYGIEAVSAGELGLPEPEETGTTFRANARIKAQAAAKASNMASFADDSGLAVDALDGAPGIHSARWAGPDKDFRLAMNEVQTKLMEQGAKAPERRRAYFVSALCVAWPDGQSRNSKPRSTARWCGRRAATRASATIRCFCPTARPIRLAKCRARTSTACRHRRAIARPMTKWTGDFRIAHEHSSSLRRPALSGADHNEAFGVYLHWPFCLSKCPYCDFNSHVRHAAIDETRFVRAFEAEIASTAARIALALSR